MRRLLVVLVLVATGCSLPLPDGVRSVEGVATEQQPSRPQVKVVPPGPKEGQTPQEVVLGFLAAQANADGRHAIARSFLTETQAAVWDDNAWVEVYDVNREPAIVVQEEGGQAGATVRLEVTGRVGADGAYTPRRQTMVEAYALQTVDGQWRLSAVPPGLRLTAADRDRSFRSVDVFYPAQVPTDASPHLVPDRVFLAAGTDETQELVERVLQPPSEALAGSVLHRAGLQVDRVSTEASGVVRVELAGSAGALSSAARQALSAQLVWTLRQLGPRFRGLRLLAGGAGLRVSGQGAVQDPGAWDSWDPNGLGPNPPYYYVASRRLRSSAQLPSNSATAGDAGDPQTIPVDAVAVTPDRTQAALLDGVAPGRVTVRVGPLRGPTYRRAVTADDLRSPSWGSGEIGLWLVRGQRDVVLLPLGGTTLQDVPVDGRPAGPLRSLAVSRDGARVALVLGSRLYVGRVAAATGTPRIEGLRLLAGGAVAVAWSTGTQVAVLGRTSAGTATVSLVTVDGSSTQQLNTGVLKVTELAASPAGLLLAAGRLVYTLDGRAPVRIGPGQAPVYPG